MCCIHWRKEEGRLKVAANLVLLPFLKRIFPSPSSNIILRSAPLSPSPSQSLMRRKISASRKAVIVATTPLWGDRFPAATWLSLTNLLLFNVLRQRIFGRAYMRNVRILNQGSSSSREMCVREICTSKEEENLIEKKELAGEHSNVTTHISSQS